MGLRLKGGWPNRTGAVLALTLLAALPRASTASAVTADPTPPTGAPAAAPIPAIGAAPAPEPAKPPEETAGTPATVIDTGAILNVLGKSVHSPTGEDMGRIVDILVDTTGALRAAVIDFGGFFGVGSRKVAVDWHALHFKHDAKGDRIVTDLPQNQLRAAPVYKDGEPVVILGRAPETGQPAESAAGTPASAPAQAASPPQAPAAALSMPPATASAAAPSSAAAPPPTPTPVQPAPATP